MEKYTKKLIEIHRVNFNYDKKTYDTKADMPNINFFAFHTVVALTKFFHFFMN